MQPARLIIFCDGGVGNRINSLISGLALANYYDLQYCVHWPENNWCAAKFDDIFKTNHPTSNLSIKNLNGKLDDAVMLLHDEIASNTLNVKFSSAYAYASMQDFEDKVVSTNKLIFYYPAVLPEWIPNELIDRQLQNLQFTDYIRNEVIGFITNVIGKPFYGLHLRRTDLNVGLNDHEVLSLVTRHKDKEFFVCSDDPVAEALACAHTNVHRREKKSYVEKKSAHQDWLAQSQDDDGRTYFGNISRSRESVIEGTIDMLVLAHSEIIGYSGSTFQKMARTIGEICPIYSISKPPALNYFSITELKRKINQNLISSELVIQICNVIGSNGEMDNAIELLQFSLETMPKESHVSILYTLSIFCLNVKKTRLATIYLKSILEIDTKNYSVWLHLAYAHLLSNEQYEAGQAYLSFQKNSPEILTDQEQNLSITVLRSINTLELVKSY